MTEQKRLWIFIGIVVIVIAGLAAAIFLAMDEDDDTAEAISVKDAWVRAVAVPDTPQLDDDGNVIPVNTAAFMTIENTRDEPARLVSASVSDEIATTVELHESVTNDQGERTMVPQEFIDIPANGSTELKPLGLHIMLIDVQRTLDAADAVTITLEFESGDVLEVEAEVRPMTEMSQ
jgi:copper(I)-binding protein